jgi:hypothetical protein
VASGTLELKINFKEIRDLSEKFKELEGKVKLSDISFRTTLKDDFSKVFEEDVRKRFMSSPSTTSGGRVFGDVYWRALSDSYLAKRPDRVQGQVLIDTTQLMQSFRLGSPNLVAEFTNNYQFKFGTRIKYAEELQKTWPIVFIHQGLLEELGKAYNNYLVKTFK